MFVEVKRHILVEATDDENSMFVSVDLAPLIIKAVAACVVGVWKAFVVLGRLS